ncbi:mandelate racemase/muconate lactonizing enzyme family protein [Chloroflexi bacterium TSY]|nr:mandelate racemase/muconate lactonizing enzyme family protein [Chloroflexi bacterium TSY]
MERARIHLWSEVEVIRVVTDSGVVGYGETIQNYTWGRVDLHERVIGRSPFELMWDDSLGAGLQMALFDAAGKLAGVPVYRLLGHPCRDTCPISFWDHDMSPEKYEQEAKVAVELGYTSLKIKTRPWFDVYETIQRISAVTPDWFCIDADWNDFLINVSNAVPVLQQLEQEYPKLKIFEGPIQANDMPGNRLLRSQIRTPIAHHYGAVPGRTAIGEGYCDGFVISGGVSRIMADGLAAAMANMPFFLQMVGTGLTTTMALHLGAVLTHAQWPAITCHELYQHPLLTERIHVAGGHARVPDHPGLGVTVDEAALEKFRVEQADLKLPKRLVKYSRACGINVYFADDSHNTSSVWTYFKNGNQPVYERGVSTELLDDDGSSGFADLYQQAKVGPVLSES